MTLHTETTGNKRPVGTGVVAISTSPKGPKAASAAKGAKTKSRTKKDQLIRMLSTKAGVDIATIGARLGWQGHSVRAALSGLRKSGHALHTQKGREGGPSRYRIDGTNTGVPE